jgi:hypothetical protein
VLSEPNGYEVESMVAAEVRSRPRWFVVPNSTKSGQLIQFSSLWPMLLLVRARRIGAVPQSPADLHLQQSYYEHLWKGDPAGETPTRMKFTHMLKTWALRRAAHWGIPDSLLRPVTKHLPLVSRRAKK